MSAHFLSQRMDVQLLYLGMQINVFANAQKHQKNVQIHGIQRSVVVMRGVKFNVTRILNMLILKNVNVLIFAQKFHVKKIKF
jgi:hypothetical protein